MALYQLRTDPELHSPVLVVALEGWVDAGLGAANAVASMLGSIKTEVIATFDTDELVDHRARRPVVRIENGVSTELRWPEIQIRCGQDVGGNDVCFLVGPEPDLRWHAFASDVVELSDHLGVRLAVGLGAFPAPAPHTRPIRLAATTTDPDLAARVGYINATIEVPGGIGAVLEHSFAAEGIQAVGLWARVPHYVAAMPFPAASAVLVDGLSRVAGLTLDASALHAAADETRGKVDDLIAQSSEHTAMVSQLEASIDAAEGNPMDIGEVPSGDQIAAELERYLRGEH